MDLFTKHVDYHDLTAFEAVSIGAVAFMAVATGVSLSVSMLQGVLA